MQHADRSKEKTMSKDCPSDDLSLSSGLAFRIGLVIQIDHLLHSLMRIVAPSTLTSTLRDSITVGFSWIICLRFNNSFSQIYDTFESKSFHNKFNTAN